MADLPRIAVCGGRDYADREVVARALSRVLARGPFVLVHGAARGADALAETWGMAHEVRGVVLEPHPAWWDMHGKRAGPIRNEEMATSGLTGLVAFPGGRGTADMVRRCEAAGVPVWRVRDAMRRESEGARQAAPAGTGAREE